MFRVVDKRDTGKTRKLLEECAKNKGIFVCAHPERVVDKCAAYGVNFTDIAKVCGYEDYLGMKETLGDVLSAVDNNIPVYIDELEEIGRRVIGYRLAGYGLTIEGKDE